MKKLKLLTGLGTNKNIILELIDFFKGGDGYQYGEEGEKVRRRFEDARLTELHLVCTSSPKVRDTLSEVQAAVSRDYPALREHIHVIELDCGDITCSGDDEDMRCKVYQEVRELAADNLIISSAGRKTVTNRLVEAGLLYGCMGYLTITSPNDSDPGIRQRTKEFNILYLPARRFSEERRQGLESPEIGDNFRSLYLLPTMLIGKLREEKIGRDPGRRAEDRQWLHKLPKADLHCHLGGAFDPLLLKEMAAGLLTDLEIDEQKRREIRHDFETGLGFAMAEVSAERLWESGQWSQDSGSGPPAHCLHILENALPGKGDKHTVLAALIEALSLEQIEEIAWNEPEELPAGRRLSWYMACGNLG